MIPDEILERCWNDVLAGRATVADCQQRFPEFPDLEAQLRLAQQLRSAAALNLRPEVARRQETDLRRYVRVHYQPAPRRRAVWQWALAAGLMMVMVFGLVTATAGSLPGDALYGLKRTTEDVQLAFFTPFQARAARYLQQEQQRLSELRRLTQRGTPDPEQLKDLLVELATTTQAALAWVEYAAPENQTAVLQAILTETEQQQVVLAMLEPTLPSAARAAWSEAQVTAVNSHTQASMQIVPVAPTPVASVTSRPTLPATFTRTPTPLPATSTLASSTATPRSPENTSEPPEPTAVPDSTGTFMPPIPTTRVPPRPTTRVPPIPTTRVPPQPTTGPGGGGPPDCTGANPNSPNYCTPTPSPPQVTLAITPTPCPTNPGGQPQCH